MAEVHFEFRLGLQSFLKLSRVLLKSTKIINKPGKFSDWVVVGLIHKLDSFWTTFHLLLFLAKKVPTLTISMSTKNEQNDFELHS